MEQRRVVSTHEDRIVRFVDQFFIRLAAIAFAALLAVYGQLESASDAGDKPQASANHTAETETAR